MSNKEKLFKFLDSLIPNDLECGHFYLTFEDGGSATIHIENKEEYEEVVMCKDCKHRDPEDKKCDCGGMPWDTQILPVPDDWYCPYGERTFKDEWRREHGRRFLDHRIGGNRILSGAVYRKRMGRVQVQDETPAGR